MAVTLEPRAPWPRPYAVFPFYVQGLQPPVDPRFQIVNGFAQTTSTPPRNSRTVALAVLTTLGGFAAVALLAYSVRAARRRRRTSLRDRVDPSDVEWAMAEDALREGRLREAARIWVNIRQDYGFVTPPKSFRDVIRELPFDDHLKFDAYVDKAQRRQLGAEQLPLPMDLGPRNATADEMYAVAEDVLREYEQYKKLKQEKTPEAREKIRRLKAVLREIKERYPDAAPPESYTKLYDKVTKPTKTYGQAQQEILGDLSTHGWQVSAQLKVPHATSPNGRLRLWFKPQAVWVTKIESGGRHEYRHARTLSYTLDIRKFDGDEFRKSLEKTFPKTLTGFGFNGNSSLGEISPAQKKLAMGVSNDAKRILKVLETNTSNARTQMRKLRDSAKNAQEILEKKIHAALDSNVWDDENEDDPDVEELRGDIEELFTLGIDEIDDAADILDDVNFAGLRDRIATLDEKL